MNVSRCAAASARWRAAPGEVLAACSRRRKRKTIEPSSAFLATAPRDTWPSRARGTAGEPPDYTPATGRCELAADERARLAAKLTELAGSRVGGSLFKGLFSLLTSERGIVRVRRARRRGPPRVRVRANPMRVRARPHRRQPAYGLPRRAACWASDRLAVLEGALGPIALTYGRARLWNALPQRFHFDIFGELYRVSHPLRRPDEYARTYQRAWQAVAAAVPTIAAAAR